MKTWNEAERSLRALGLQEIHRELIEGAMNCEIDAVKLKYAKRIARFDRKITAVTARLEAFCDAHRDDMQPAGKKEGAGLVWKSTWGKLAWRKCPPAIEFTVKKVEKVLAALKAKRLTNCIRTVEEPNKDVLLSLDAATLSAVHCRKKPSEKFEAKPDHVGIVNPEA